MTDLELDLRRRYERGDPVLVEAYLAENPSLADDAHAVVRLLVLEYRLRLGRGEPAAVEEYGTRFPEYAGLLRGLLLAELPTPHAGEDSLTSGLPEYAGYRVVAELGRGGMGTVYKAWHERLRCWVAIKALHGVAGRERLLREAEAIARLRHPNIVRIHDVGEGRAGEPFLVLEYVEGGSLSRAVAGKPMSPVPAAALAEALARAVQHAHDAGIVHRDLKPANVLLAAPSEPKVTDFGLAKDLHGERGLTASGDVLGTPSYMAPEQVRGHGGAVGPAADVYALGAILYELLTGRPPFQAATNVETVLLVLREDPVAPRRLQPKLPRDLETVCLKCLEKDPARRYGTATALADDLRCFLDHRPVKARPVSWLRRAAQWGRRNPALAAILLLTLLSLSALGAQWYRFTLDLKAQRDRAEQNANEANRQAGLAVANLRKARETAERFFLTVRDHKELRSQPTQALRLELSRQALALQEKLIEDYDGLPDLLAEQAASYHLLGKLVNDLESPKASLPYLRKAIELGQRLTEAAPDDPRRQADLASYESTLANRLSELGQADEAERLARSAIARGERLVASGRTGVVRLNLANAKLNLGLSLRRRDRLRDAEQLYSSARADAEELVRGEPDVPDYLNLLGMACNNLAVMYQRGGRPALAAEAYAESIRTRTDLVRLAPGQPEYQQGLAVTWFNAAGLYRAQQRDEEAAAAYSSAIAVQSRLVELHPTPRGYRADLARILEHAGEYSRARQRGSEAAARYAGAVSLRQRLADETADEPGPARQLATCLIALSGVAEPTDEIVSLVQGGVARLGRWPDNQEMARLRGDLITRHAALARQLGRPARADEQRHPGSGPEEPQAVTTPPGPTRPGRLPVNLPAPTRAGTRGSGSSAPPATPPGAFP
jgi:serine/threonine-protein kinase